MTLLHIDCAEGLRDMGAETVDIIFTDPPYLKDMYEDAYTILQQEADRLLRPGGWLITYAPQYHLSQVLGILESGALQYYWMVAQLNQRNANCIIHARRVMAMWKPILIFEKPPISKPPHAFCDTISGKRMKAHHPWEQSIHEALGLLSRFAAPGDLVVDPFMGSGTVPLAAKLLGLDCIGMEKDEGTYQTACSRLEQEPLNLATFTGGM